MGNLPPYDAYREEADKLYWKAGLLVKATLLILFAVMLVVISFFFVNRQVYLHPDVPVATDLPVHYKSSP